ncbi:MAG: HEAT repeat domain-containing protein [Aphanizomenon sp.]|jgi:HEAT repeat protein
MSESKIDSLLKQCSCGESSLVIEAIQELIDLKAYSAVPTIVALLSSDDIVIRFTAAEALGDLGKLNPEFVGKELVKLLVDSEAIVRAEAVDSLGILTYTAAIAPIMFLLKNDPDPLVRASAAETLGDLGQEEAIAAIFVALVDTDESVRAYAANSIGLLGTPTLLPKLAAYIKSENSLRVKAELLGARYRLGAKEDINLFLDLLENANEDLATALLNILTDLIDRKQPLYLPESYFSMTEVLTKLSDIFPILSPQINGLIVQLKTIPQS